MALARGGRVGVLADLEAARRQLPQKSPGRVPVLPHQQHPPIVGDRDEDDGAVVPHDLQIGLAAVRQADAVHRDVEDAPFVDEARVEDSGHGRSLSVS